MSTHNRSQGIDRRTFLKMGSLGAAATTLGLGSAAVAAETPPADIACRTLGRTGMKYSVVGIGTLKTDEPAVMQAAFDRGVNHIDTARVYLEGRNEAMVAKALKGYRDKVYVSTKTKPADKATMQGWRDQSLKELQLDYVDILYLHNITSREQVLNEEYRSVFIEAKAQGKTRFIGVTTHKNEADVINAAVEDPDKLWDVILVKYNFQSPPDVKEAIARAAKAGLGIVAMKTQAGGYKTDDMGGISPHQAALKYVLNDTNVTCAVPGMVDLQQVVENTAVLQMMKLTRADRNALERYGRAIADRYCRGCGGCNATCPRNIDVQGVNRCLMYAEGYGDLGLARAAHHELARETSASACRACGTCVARCVHGLDLAERMAEAQRLFV